MPPRWVRSVTITPDNKMTLSVDVTDFQDTTGPIEITGEVTQVNGAWARISTIADRAAATKEGDKYFVDAEAIPIPPPGQPFAIDEDVTIFVRVAQTWITVLGPGADGSGPKTQMGQIWAKYKTASQLPEGGGPQTAG